MPRDSEEWYSRKPSKLVKENPIQPFPIAAGPPTATGASGSKEGTTEEVYPPRDPSVKHHLLDDYDAWNKRWLETGVVENTATLRTLPTVLGSGGELEERFRLFLRAGTETEGRALQVLTEQYEEFVAQLAFTGEAIGKLERRGRKVERRRAAALEKARRRAEEESQHAETARREAVSERESVAAGEVGEGGEDAAGKTGEGVAVEMAGPGELRGTLEVSSRSKGGSSVEAPVDLTMSSPPRQGGAQDVGTTKSTPAPGYPDTAQDTAQTHSHGSREKHPKDPSATTSHSKINGEDPSTKRKHSSPRSSQHRSFKGKGHGTAVRDVKNGITGKKIKKARSTKTRSEEAPDPAQQALNERRRNALRALLQIP